MDLFLQFVSLYWYLFGLLSLLVGLLVFSENRKAGPTIGTQELSTLVNKQDAVIVDVRPVKEFKQGHIINSVNIPVETFTKRQTELEKYKTRPIIVICKFGQHSATPAKALLAEGFNVLRLRGGITEWTSSQLPTVKG